VSAHAFPQDMLLIFPSYRPWASRPSPRLAGNPHPAGGMEQENPDIRSHHSNCLFFFPMQGQSR
jgi:hypothetical protein